MGTNQNNTETRRQFYFELDELLSEIVELRKQFGDSQILQVYCNKIFSSLIYGNVILNFFSNLNQKYIIENNLPKGKITRIRNHYRKSIRNSVLGTKKPFNLQNIISKDYYEWFKSDLHTDYPEFDRIIHDLEKILDMKHLERYLNRSQKKISKTFNGKSDLDTQLYTIILEEFIENGNFSRSKNDLKLIVTLLKKSIDQSTSSAIKSLEEKKMKTLTHMHTANNRFKARLYQRWKEPLDLLELLINSSIEIGQNVKTQLADSKKKVSNARHVALIKIHARAIQVANEILTLLKAGYVDGANGRWRTLYELTGIFLILKNNTGALSYKYLEHEAVKKFKKVNDLEVYHRRLGYSTLPRRTFQHIKDEYHNLQKKYGPSFKKDLGWIPKDILDDCSFKALTTKVGIDHYLPFYNSSSDAVHGGAQGFYRMGLPRSSQDDVLLAGPSDYGLADPIQNTTYCLKLLDVTFLSINPTLHNILGSKLLAKFFDNIGELAVKVHKNMELKISQAGGRNAFSDQKAK